MNETKTLYAIEVTSYWTHMHNTVEILADGELGEYHYYNRDKAHDMIVALRWNPITLQHGETRRPRSRIIKVGSRRYRRASVTSLLHKPTDTVATLPLA